MYKCTVYNVLYIRIGGKVRLVKALEGSATLRQWKQLATPDLNALLAATTISGVQMRSSSAVARAAALLEEEGEDDYDDEDDDDALAGRDSSRTPTEERGTTVTYSNSRIAGAGGSSGGRPNRQQLANAPSPASTPQATQQHEEQYRTPYPNMHLPRLAPRAPGPIELLLRAHGLGAASSEELAARSSGLLARRLAPEDATSSAIKVRTSGAVLGLNSLLVGGAGSGASIRVPLGAGATSVAKTGLNGSVTVRSARRPVPRHVITTTMGLNSVQLLGDRPAAAANGDPLNSTSSAMQASAPDSDEQPEPSASASDPLVSNVLSAALSSVASARLDYRSLFSLLKRSLVHQPSKPSASTTTTTSTSASSSHDGPNASATASTSAIHDQCQRRLEDLEDGRATPTPESIAAALD